MDFLFFVDVYLQRAYKSLLFLMNYAPTILVYILNQPLLRANELQKYAVIRGMNLFCLLRLFVLFANTFLKLLAEYFPPNSPSNKYSEGLSFL